MKTTLKVGFLFATLFASYGMAQEKKPAEARMVISDEKAEFATFTSDAKAKGCFSGSIRLSDGGHKWTIATNNTCGRVLQCEMTVVLKSANGSGTGNCSVSVPTGKADVCSAYNANVVWTSGSGSATCK